MCPPCCTGKGTASRQTLPAAIVVCFFPSRRLSLGSSLQSLHKAKKLPPPAFIL